MFENVTYLHANNCINKEEHSNQQDDVGQSLKYKIVSSYTLQPTQMVTR